MAVNSVSVASRFDPVPTVACLAAVAVCAGLYQYQTALYMRLLGLWMGEPFRVPFIDLHFVVAGVECWSKGVDVYAQNPCDLLDRPHNYSPLFLRFSFIPTGSRLFVLPVLVVLGGYLAAIGALPWPRGPAVRVWMLLGILSPAAAFALERGNLDLTMFAAATLAGVCLGGRLPARIVGYAIFLVIGLLKIYPLALLVLVLRERRIVAFGVAACSAAVLAGYGAVYGDELRRMAANIPTWGPAGIAWGAKSLPIGVNAVLPHVAAPGLFAALFAMASVGAMYLARRSYLADAIGRLPPRAGILLSIGAAATCGCFFAGQSLPYRAIFLLLALPAFLALSHTPGDRGVTRFGWIATALVLLALWQDAILRAALAVFGGMPRPNGDGTVNYPAWVLSELAWWCLIAILMATLIIRLRPADRRYGATHPPAAACHHPRVV